MNLNEEVEVLKSVPIFAKMEMAKLKLIAFTGERMNYSEGQELCHQGHRRAPSCTECSPRPNVPHRLARIGPLGSAGRPPKGTDPSTAPELCIGRTVSPSWLSTTQPGACTWATAPTSGRAA